MQLSDFHFELPDELIARFPTENRCDSRLLHLDGSGEIHDRQFIDLIDQLNPKDCLIFNNTKVMPARLLGNRDSGGAVELLIERVLDEQNILTQIKSSNKLKPDSIIHVGEYVLRVLGRESMFYQVALEQPKRELSGIDSGASSRDCESASKTESLGSIWDLLAAEGHMPLPPYIDRPDSEFDMERYQTVYAKYQGAVAAPTAGLHFTDNMLEAIQTKGISTGFVTLHVGSGTFSPVRADNILEHKMHSEWFEVSSEVAALVRRTKEQGGRVIAVGTTSVRCLETASQNGEIEPTSGDTDIFIYPGYQFQCVDALVTNFHLPESTLIMLVSAFSGTEHLLKAYRHAVTQAYRFFSYGDAMLLELAPLTDKVGSEA